MNKRGITDRMNDLGDRAKERMTHARMEKLDRDNERLRGELAALRDDLEQERGTLKDALRSLGDERQAPPRRSRRPRVVRAVVIAAGAYVLGTRAGRERYDQIVARMRSIREGLRDRSDGDASERWGSVETSPIGAADRTAGSGGIEGA
ncbi:MAG TPA: hypothetical protein VIE12_11495 [Actinomycetota bacterium]|jgi:hypothetical protein